MDRRNRCEGFPPILGFQDCHVRFLAQAIIAEDIARLFVKGRTYHDAQKAGRSCPPAGMNVRSRHSKPHWTEAMLQQDCPCFF